MVGTPSPGCRRSGSSAAGLRTLPGAAPAGHRPRWAAAGLRRTSNCPCRAASPPAGTGRCPERRSEKKAAARGCTASGRG
ncbi:hypothetical protein G6F59_018265 [Rhizopus arrhizus]|nr:hypothetical protein G6F59_018265 [Rhizopus arrhizus]